MFRIIEKQQRRLASVEFYRVWDIQYLMQLNDLRRGVVLHRCGIVRVSVIVAVVTVHFLLADHLAMHVVRVSGVWGDRGRTISTAVSISVGVGIGLRHSRTLRRHLDPLVLLSRTNGQRECVF